MGEEGTREAASPPSHADESGGRGAQVGRKFHPAGYRFLHEALFHTRVDLGREGHVSGTELLEGVRKLALEQFGPLARVVLEHWGITCTEDVGAMVKDLTDSGLWARREEDSWDDFQEAYDFREVFEKNFPWQVREALGLDGEPDID